MKLLTSSVGAELARVFGKALVLLATIKRKAARARKFVYKDVDGEFLITGDTVLHKHLTWQLWSEGNLPPGWSGGTLLMERAAVSATIGLAVYSQYIVVWNIDAEGTWGVTNANGPGQPSQIIPFGGYVGGVEIAAVHDDVVCLHGMPPDWVNINGTSFEAGPAYPFATPSYMFYPYVVFRPLSLVRDGGSWTIQWHGLAEPVDPYTTYYIYGGKVRLLNGGYDATHWHDSWWSCLAGDWANTTTIRDDYASDASVLEAGNGRVIVTHSQVSVDSAFYQAVLIDVYNMAEIARSATSLAFPSSKLLSHSEGVFVLGTETFHYVPAGGSYYSVDAHVVGVTAHGAINISLGTYYYEVDHSPKQLDIEASASVTTYGRDKEFSKLVYSIAQLTLVTPTPAAYARSNEISVRTHYKPDGTSTEMPVVGDQFFKEEPSGNIITISVGTAYLAKYFPGNNIVSKVNFPSLYSLSDVVAEKNYAPLVSSNTMVATEDGRHVLCNDSTGQIVVTNMTSKRQLSVAGTPAGYVPPPVMSATSGLAMLYTILPMKVDGVVQNMTYRFIVDLDATDPDTGLPVVKDHSYIPSEAGVRAVLGDNTASYLVDLDNSSAFSNMHAWCDLPGTGWKGEDIVASITVNGALRHIYANKTVYRAGAPRLELRP